MVIYQKENGWLHRPTAERKTRSYSNVLDARRRQKKEGEAEEDMAKYIQRRPGRDLCKLAWIPRIARDRVRWRLLVARCSERNRQSNFKVTTTVSGVTSTVCHSFYIYGLGTNVLTEELCMWQRTMYRLME